MTPRRAERRAKIGRRPAVVGSNLQSALYETMRTNRQSIKPHDCDVLVVGAGPAGATAARLLAAGGMRVLLLDKKRFPRRKLCAGLITWKTVQVLREVFGLEPADLERARIIHYHSRDYAVRNRSRALVCGRLDYPFHFVDRSAYDALWVDLAREAGAEICPGEAVSGVDVGSGTVTTNRRTLRPGAILAADGANSRIRRQLHRNGHLRAIPHHGMALGIEAIFRRGPHAGFSDRPEIYLGVVPWGYGWSFPGAEHQLVGLCGLIRRSRGGTIRQNWHAFLRALAVRADPPESIACHPVPYGNFVARGGHRSVLLLGDACGLADPLLGEGIYYAHRSGQLAAAAVMEAQPRWQEVQPCYARRLKPAVIDELQRIRWGRCLAFTVLAAGDYRCLAFVMKRFQKRVEAMVQGQRRFGVRSFARRWDRPRPS